MAEAVLFDLDDTLLGNSMDTFLPAYFRALTRYLEHLIPPERLIAQLMHATDAMDAHHSVQLTNEEAFASAFYPALEQDRSNLEPLFQRFYIEEFPKLRPLTCARPEARLLVQRALDEDLQVVVATNPLFPRIAVEQRLAWAGVPVDQFDYALVTTYENMHATKSHPAYYREILSRIGRRPDECLMVGDSWELDVAPASSVGLRVFWISDGDEPPLPCGSPLVSPAELLIGHGTLAELLALVKERDWFPKAWE